MLPDIFIFILIFFSVAVFKKLKIIDLADTIKVRLMKSFNVFRSAAISDHWKELYMLKNSLRTLGLSLRMTLLIVIFLFGVFILLKIADAIFPDFEIFKYLITTRGIVVSILPFIAYYFFNRFLNKKA